MLYHTLLGGEKSSMSNCPIFIVGYLHSGTTLLRNIFQDHPDIFTGEGETRFFYYLPTIRRNFPDLTDDQTLHDYLFYLARLIRTNYGKVHIERDTKGLSSFQTLGFSQTEIDALYHAASEQRDHAKLFGLVSDALCIHYDKERWLEKTPTHLFHIDAILEATPNARFIAIVRDPRDVLSSKRSRQQEEWINQTNVDRRAVKKIQAGFDPLWDTLAWKSAVRAVSTAETKHPGRILSIRYLDLVTEPEATVRSLCDFLELDYYDTMLDVGWVNSTTRSRQNRGIGTASVGKWQKNLTPEMVALCQAIARREMKMLDFPLTPIALSTQLKMPLLLGRSGYEFFERLGRRWRIGGFGFVRNVLENYWLRFVNVR